MNNTNTFAELTYEKSNAIALIMERVLAKDKDTDLTHQLLENLIKETKELMKTDF
tara:strand:+ start:528 stop:692 length:165 start_codon:yes stop_codon:yes gene_type:complete